MISGYSYDKLTKVRSEIYQPMNWTEFIDYIMPKLNDTERKCIDLLTDERQGYSQYTLLLTKDHADDIYTITLAVIETTENKEQLSDLFFVVYNRYIDL